MKFRVTLKDPDAFYEAIRAAIKQDLKAMQLDVDEHQYLLDSRIETTLDAISRYVTYNEYVTLEFDTDQGTAIVVHNKS